MNQLKGVGPALRLLRKGRDLSAATVAKRMKSNESNVNDRERLGANPEAKTIGRTLTAMGCNVHDLAVALDKVNKRAVWQYDEGKPTPEVVRAVKRSTYPDAPEKLVEDYLRLDSALERVLTRHREVKDRVLKFARKDLFGATKRPGEDEESK